MASKLGLLGASGEEEEEEEDEPMEQPFLKPPTTTTSTTTVTAPAPMSTDVAELQAALQAAEAKAASYRQALCQREREAKAMGRQLRDLAAFQSPTEAWARRTLLDPSVALEMRLLHDRIAELEAVGRRHREEAQAAQFSAQSATGQMLVAKVRKLEDQNAELTAKLQSADQWRDEKARLEAELGRLRLELAEAQAQNEELDEERGSFATLIYTLKKQLAHYQRQQQAYEEGGDGKALGAAAAKMEVEEGSGKPE